MSNHDERLRAEIERLGVSNLARALGIARNTLYNWAEKGNVPLDKLLALGAEGVDVQYIMTGQRITPNGLSPKEEALLDNYRNSTEQGKKAVETTASAFAYADTSKKSANGG